MRRQADFLPRSHQRSLGLRLLLKSVSPGVRTCARVCVCVTQLLSFCHWILKVENQEVTSYLKWREKLRSSREKQKEESRFPNWPDIRFKRPAKITPATECLVSTGFVPNVRWGQGLCKQRFSHSSARNYTPSGVCRSRFKHMNKGPLPTNVTETHPLWENKIK